MLRGDRRCGNREKGSLAFIRTRTRLGGRDPRCSCHVGPAGLPPATSRASALAASGREVGVGGLPGGPVAKTGAFLPSSRNISDMFFSVTLILLGTGKWQKWQYYVFLKNDILHKRLCYLHKKGTLTCLHLVIGITSKGAHIQLGTEDKPQPQASKEQTQVKNTFHHSDCSGAVMTWERLGTGRCGAQPGGEPCQEGPGGV